MGRKILCIYQQHFRVGDVYRLHGGRKCCYGKYHYVNALIVFVEKRVKKEHSRRKEKYKVFTYFTCYLLEPLNSRQNLSCCFMLEYDDCNTKECYYSHMACLIWVM